MEVSKTGYPAMEKPDSGNIVISIEGMTCVACAQRIERVVGKLEGVAQVSVNYATDKAVVTYNPQQVRVSAIKESIRKVGYTPLEAATTFGADEERVREAEEIHTLLIKFIIAAIFALPLLYVAMAPMITWIDMPLPGGLDPIQYPLVYALTQLLLVIPIIGAGYQFYNVGFKVLLQLSPNMDSLIAIGSTAAVVYSGYNVMQIAAGQNDIQNRHYGLKESD